MPQPAPISKRFPSAVCVAHYITVVITITFCCGVCQELSPDLPGRVSTSFVLYVTYSNPITKCYLLLALCVCPELPDLRPLARMLNLVPPVGSAPTTPDFSGRCSTRLSYNGKYLVPPQGFEPRLRPCSGVNVVAVCILVRIAFYVY